MQLDEYDSLLLRRCEIDRKGEHEDRGDEEQGQPVEEPDHRVENAQFGIAIGPQHPNTSLSCTCTAGRRGDRIGRAFIPAAPSCPSLFVDENGFWIAPARPLPVSGCY